MSFSITALQLVNRVNRRRRIEDSQGIGTFEELTTLDAVNSAMNRVLSERDWEWDIRHAQLSTKALLEGVTIGTTAGSTNLLATHSSLNNNEVYGDWILRANLVGSTDYTNTALRLISGTSVIGGSSLFTAGASLGESVSSTTGELFYAEYLLPETVKSVIRTRHQEQTLTLEQVGAEIEFDELHPRQQIRRGSPEQVSVGGFDVATHIAVSGAPEPRLRMIVFPVPDDEYVIDYSYRYRHPELTDATSTLEGVPPEVVDGIVKEALQIMKRDFDRLGEDAAAIGRDAQTSLDEIHDRHKGQSSERRRVHNWDGAGTSGGSRYSIHQGRTIGS